MMSSLKITAGNAEMISHQLTLIINRINSGDGTLGKLIQDPAMADNLKETIANFKSISIGLKGTDTLMTSLKITADNARIISHQLSEIMADINKGKGTLGRLIKDSTMAENLNLTLINLRRGSKGFDENMTAAKHNFLFKGYFERKAKNAAEKQEANKKLKDKK